MKIKKIWLLYFVGVVLAVICVRNVHLAVNELSATYDEPFHITAGYTILKTGDYAYQAIWHPPLAEMIEALPLALLSRDKKPILETTHPAYLAKRNYEMADWFFHNNRIPPEDILHQARWALFIVCFPLLGLFLYKFSEEIEPGSGIWAIILLLIEPNLIAHSSLATTDFAASVFYVASFYALWRYLRSPTPVLAGFCGAMWALSFLSKYSNLTACFGLVFLLILERKRIFKDPRIFTMLPWAFLGLAACFLIVYQFKFPGYYIEGVEYMFKQTERGRSSFFMGEYANRGWIMYFPVLFLIKTNIIHIVLAILGISMLMKNAIKTDQYTAIYFLLLVPFVHFVFACSSSVQIGLRYILPVYPFAILLGSIGISKVLGTLSAQIRNSKSMNFGRASKKAQVKAKLAPSLGQDAILIVLLFGIFSCYKVSPWFVAYFNEFIGGPKNSYKYFTDSNNDWGQGLKALGEYLEKEGVGSIYLSYFGVGDPAYYGIKYIPIGMISNTKRHGNPEADPTGEKKVYLAVSATNIQSTYYADREIFKWLNDVTPEVFLGYSILLYDITENSLSRKKLGAVLEKLGRREQARKLREGIE
ncbi:ArnT family glycosyltransferase [Elusimicrobiota bacterium]